MAGKDDPTTNTAESTAETPVKTPTPYEVVQLYRCKAADWCLFQALVQTREDKARFAAHLKNEHGIEMLKENA